MFLRRKNPIQDYFWLAVYTKFMLKRFFVFFLVVFSFFVFTDRALAQNEFNTDVYVLYSVGEGGVTTVDQTITLENAFSNLYATNYTLVLENIQPRNPRAFDSSRTLTLNSRKEGIKTYLEVKFDDAVIGRGNKRIFHIVFEDNSFAVRTGEVWEIDIPKLTSEESFRNYTLDLSVPTSLGKLAYMSPTAIGTRFSEGRAIYNFEKENVLKTGIVAGFGEFQIFSFTLNYHLENPLAKTASVDIAIPPDTALQRMYYQQISPKPSNVHVDSDGNWLATYNLKPRERVDINVNGTVQIFAGPRPFPKPTRESLLANLKESEYWQTLDPQIIDLANSLKTPRSIYDFVSTKLTYDYQRVRPNIDRLGAKGTLENPQNAICMEFTDLFIALSRAAKVPAREVNGFAYTENPEIQPLSLVADVLHAWPEYWNYDLESWIPVDPTWASTTGGVDYFSKFDLRHFTFVIHGSDATKPFPPGSYKLGTNPQKDVYVSFGQLPEKRNGEVEISVLGRENIPFLFSKINVIIKNKGPAALYNLSPQVYFDESLAYAKLTEVLPPFSEMPMEISVPFSFFGNKTPETITILVSDQKVEIPTNKNQAIIYSLIVFSVFLIVLILLLLISLKKIDLTKIKARIVKTFKKEGSNENPNPPGQNQPQ